MMPVECCPLYPKAVDIKRRFFVDMSSCTFTHQFPQSLPQSLEPHLQSSRQTEPSTCTSTAFSGGPCSSLALPSPPRLIRQPVSNTKPWYMNGRLIDSYRHGWTPKEKRPYQCRNIQRRQLWWHQPGNDSRRNGWQVCQLLQRWLNPHRRRFGQKPGWLPKGSCSMVPWYRYAHPSSPFSW